MTPSNVVAYYGEFLVTGSGTEDIKCEGLFSVTLVLIESICDHTTVSHIWWGWGNAHFG